MSDGDGCGKHQQTVNAELSGHSVLKERNMMRYHSRIVPVLLLIAAFLLTGCVTAGNGKKAVSKVKQAFEGTYTVDPYMEEQKPRTIAILPFVDQSKSQEGTEAVRRGFYNHFSSLPFRDMELVQIDHLLRKAGLHDPEQLSATSPEKLKHILNVDAVIYGTISNFDKIFAGIYSQVSVGAEIKMYEAATGQFLWSGQHVVRIHQGSLPTSPIGIISSIISAAMNVRDIQLLRACDDLFRDMVKTIPAIEAARARKAPAISLLAQDSKGLPKKAGDEIRVFLKGTPGLTAWFDVGSLRKGVDMEEIEPGGYVGTYRVVPGDNIEGAIIVGYLDDSIGHPTQWVDALGTITIDTTPPGTPSNGIAIGRDQSVSLAWDDNTEADLAGYILYKSETPLSGFSSIGQTEFTAFEDGDVENLRTYYYRVSAIDRAGNESREKHGVSGTPVPPGPTPVSGEIDADTTWYAGAGPYVIEDTVTVTENGALTIEPGTEIRSNGKGLTVRGALRVGGSKKRIVTFGSNTEDPWDGILFERAKEGKSAVEFARIESAETGISCISSSPAIAHNELVNNQNGLAISGSYSMPTVDGNTVHENQSNGITVADGAAPQILNNQIKNNGGTGVVAESAGTGLVKSNTIIGNLAAGIAARKSQLNISGNNIYDNQPVEIEGQNTGNPLLADDNWWGDSDWMAVFEKIRGRISIDRILSKPIPEGEPIDIPVQKGDLEGMLDRDAVLTLANSPYRVARDLTVDGGAVLTIQPGVELHYDQQTSVILKDGGISARGNADQPIVFISSSSSPSPGDYLNAVRFTQQTSVSSFFSYCVFRYATTALDVQFGMPEVVHSTIADNSQSGIRCANDASPRILYSTISRNLGSGGIECVGLAKPKINYNNFSENTVAIQAFSTIFIDAKHNYWGSAPPNKDAIFGVNINIEPWLEAPEGEAFCSTCGD